MALAKKPFVVLDAEILSSSVWSETASVRLVWITLLILCDTEGYVGASVPGIASAAGVPLQDAEDALRRLQEPDKYSRTQAHEGRRVEVTERGWRVLNFMEHLDRLSSERTRARDRMWRHRQRKKEKRQATTQRRQRTTKQRLSPQGVGTSEKGIGNREQTENERPLSVDSEKPPDGNGHGIPEDQRHAYADEVWTEFLKVSGQRATRVISPGEFAVLKAWMDSGVPLRIVIRGMTDTKGKGQSLSYYAGPVQDAYEYHRQAVPL